MPVVLVNSHSHQFSYPDGGKMKTVNVKRGQDIEELGIPERVVEKLLTEMVPHPTNKSRVPRYRRMDVAPALHKEGAVTAASVEEEAEEKVEAPVAEKSEEPTYTPEEMEELQRQAEEAIAQEAADAADAEAEKSAEAAAEEAAAAIAAEAAEEGVSPVKGITGGDLPDALAALNNEELAAVVEHDSRKTVVEAAKKALDGSGDE